MPGFFSRLCRRGKKKKTNEVIIVPPQPTTTQFTRRQSTRTRKRSTATVQPTTINEVPLQATVAPIQLKRQPTVRRASTRRRRTSTIRRKHTADSNKSVSSRVIDDKSNRNEENVTQPIAKPVAKVIPTRPLPLEQTTCSKEHIEAIEKLLENGKINIKFDEIKSVANEFALYASKLTTKGALEEYAKKLKDYVPKNMTKVNFDKNMQLNRYKDVVCADLERVILNCPDASNDYIHANYVRGSPLNQNFICTQGPTTDSLTHFLQMIVQERVKSIVMLCETIECRREKCVQYYPLYDNETIKIEHSDLEVTNNGRFIHEKGFITTILTVRNLKLNTEQTVYHHQWKNWPDRGVPENYDTVLKILQLIRTSSNDSNTVIHCSAGIGRTGTVIGIELAIQSLLSNKTPNLIELVKFLRQRRAQSVQTDIQYEFIYKIVCHFIQSMEPDLETSKALNQFLDKPAPIEQNPTLLLNKDQPHVEYDDHQTVFV